MSYKTIAYQETGYFSELVSDYLAKKPPLQPFYNRFPNVENFKKQLVEKSLSLIDVEQDLMRNTLLNTLNNQYQDITISEATKNNIHSLSRKNSFTITTGHQLNLFTGPLYFLYKIFSVINLTEELNKKYLDNHFVPVYWMATEDHDFDEINNFNLFGNKIEWKKEASGAVGELKTEGLEEVFRLFSKQIENSDTAKHLKELFSEGYLKNPNLTKATRYIANELFKEYGLVIVDGNDSALKQLFVPYVKKELFEKRSFSEITKTTNKLIKAGYHQQVYPREINVFYLKEGLRERIMEKNGIFTINNTSFSFTAEELLKELENHPERFSPNALLRSLYQEVVLPNICYVGGGAEVAYWFQLKDYFKSVSVTFPIVLLRNSALIFSEKTSKKLQKLEVPIAKLFLPKFELETWYTKKMSNITIDFSKQKKYLKKQFEELYLIAKKTDKSFVGAVAAQEKKQLKGLETLEKRLLKAQKRKFAEQLKRLVAIQDELFPKGSLQERTINFSELYLEHGQDLLRELKNDLKPLCNEFTIIEI